MKLVKRSGSLPALVLMLVLGFVGSLLGATPASAGVRSCERATAPSVRPTLVVGDTGTCVRTLQTNLLNRGWALGGYGADGKYRPTTASAIKRFQRKHGLAVTGNVNRATWLKLGYGPASPRLTYDVRRGPNYTSAVVLSYDDCPNSAASFRAGVLEAERLNVGLVLFPLGTCISDGRVDVAFARAHGHYVFNHTINHPNLLGLSSAQIKRQLGAPGVVTDIGRAPYGAGTFENTANGRKVRAAYADMHMKMWYWTYDTNDWRGYSRATIVNGVIRNAAPRSTILGHMQHQGWGVTPIRQMVTGIRAKGLRICRNFIGTTPNRLRGDQMPC